MAYLLRLIAFFLLISSSFVEAYQYPAPTMYRCPVTGGAYIYSSAAEACTTGCGGTYNGSTCTVNGQPWGKNDGPGCPAGETLSYQYPTYYCNVPDVQCTPPQIANTETNTCEDPPNPCEDLQGTKITGSYTYTNNPQQSTCAGGCEFLDSSNVTVCLNSGDCHTDAFTATGNQCTANEEEATDSVCPEGQSPYSINGVESCIDHLDNPDATTQETDTTTVTDQTNNTETTTETSTECNGGTCTTTNTTTTTDNNTGQSTQQTETTEQPQNTFCKQNPEAAICKEKKTSFGGDCNSAFTCEGDAVQCAIAREQHIRNCALFDSPTTLSDLGNDIANGNDSLTTPSPDNPETIAFNPQIDSSNPYSDTGLTDMSVDFKGQVLTIPFSNLNDSLNILGNILLASSWLFALVTLKGAVVD